MSNWCSRKGEYGTESVYDEIMTGHFIEQMRYSSSKRTKNTTCDREVTDSAVKGEKSRVMMKRRELKTKNKIVLH